MTTVPVISVVDDDPSVRSAVSFLVRSLGYTAHAFASALDLLRSPHLDGTWCVITDIRMPEMSGVELQSQVRAKGSRVPFIFITAVPDESVRARAFEEGATCFLTKPFDENVLIECLDTAVQEHRDKTGG